MYISKITKVQVSRDTEAEFQITIALKIYFKRKNPTYMYIFVINI